MRCIRELNGAGSQCGRCVGHAKEVLGEALAERRAAQAKSIQNQQKEPVTVVTGAGSGVCYP